ncbi:cupin domain-containing protein [Mangrovimonas sp. ST2L15]|uniref:cupin domain-containing protein n=1 Tax=Mangrovimonas sp. ST2L15 TaxID=1645916 RepID=UPI0006B4DA26|nr:cupin domain-containing protein [Mangrovimonas sp. ST2L15]
MKTNILTLMTFLIFSASVLAQDWKQLNPDGIKILADTTLVRSVKITIEPGEIIGPVTHPAHFAYIMTDGKLRVHNEGKEPVVMELKEGTPLYFNPVGPHKTENVGDKPFTFLIVELKEHPYKPAHN